MANDTAMFMEVYGITVRKMPPISSMANACDVGIEVTGVSLLMIIWLI